MADSVPTLWGRKKGGKSALEILIIMVLLLIRFGRRDHLVRHIRKRHSGSPEEEEDDDDKTDPLGIRMSDPGLFPPQSPEPESTGPQPTDPLPDFSSVFVKSEPFFKPDNQ